MYWFCYIKYFAYICGVKSAGMYKLHHLAL
nr:MAG TPA: hypothetical protein [Caudoviricetes sp.]